VLEKHPHVGHHQKEIMMTYEELVEFVGKQMRMSHIYQPLLIKALINSNGIATLRQLSYAFLAEDESQLLYYEGRIKGMPVPVLAKHGVVAKDGDLIRLNVGKLTFQQKARLRALCEQKIQEFLEKRGLATFDYRLLETDPVPDTIRFEVLKRAKGLCQLCGCSAKERPLHVDHIIPRSKKGTNDLENLQALCVVCNLAKSNRDTTDFRDIGNKTKASDCSFCNPDMAKREIERNGSVFAIEDKYPVTKGHCLIVPDRHATDFFELTQTERNQADDLVRLLKNRIQGDDKAVTGFNLGYNCGRSAGQTIMHAHLHLIPRRDGDLKYPEGGIRGVIPDKRMYSKR